MDVRRQLLIRSNFEKSNSVSNKVKLEIDNKKKQFEKFKQLLMSGIQNKKYNLSY